jgi:hypothetical protein
MQENTVRTMDMGITSLDTMGNTQYHGAIKR